MFRSLIFIATLAICSPAFGQHPMDQEFARNPPQQQFAHSGHHGGHGGQCKCGCQGSHRPQPTVCCHKQWDPYAYSRSYWDPCYGLVTCWYGAYVTRCQRPCNNYGGGGFNQVASYDGQQF